MSVKRLNTYYRKNASRFHKAVGNYLKKNYGSFRIYQEYPIPSSKFFVDWFILDLNIAIEVHGEQHYGPVAFDGNKEQSILNYEIQVKRDRIKKNLIKEAGWIYVVMKYNELTDEFINLKIQEALNAIIRSRTQS
jgi:very-short-patch-repair endonuclease